MIFQYRRSNEHFTIKYLESSHFNNRTAENNGDCEAWMLRCSESEMVLNNMYLEFFLSITF